MRSEPVIIVTGTPGVGKTSHCELLASRTGLRHLSVNQVVKEKECHSGWDGEYSCWTVDDDKLLDAMEGDVARGGCLIDWHACEVFPSSWVDLVIVLRAQTSTLYDRLQERKYTEAKLQENLDSEIMDVIIEEARGAYDAEIVIELPSNSTEDMESNVARIQAWIEQWKEDQADRQGSK